ncbi:unnamed protein product [Linum tenue]|uniref:Uncharacterized protein n=3 Tax=Linum tenue TaxID=586396 RepID=A0AAV0L1S4_9ROSI|nr:unnamed protein product [Linum tenue]
MPLFPTLEGELVLTETGAEALVRTMKMKAMVSTITVAPLSKLTYLRLREMDELEALPAEGLPNLTSLQELTIWKCSRFASLPPAMRRLTSLQTLIIKGCSQLQERCIKGDGEDWPNISHIPNIELLGLYEDTFQDPGWSSLAFYLLEPAYSLSLPFSTPAVRG